MQVFSELLSRIGKKIVMRRKELNLTQDELAFLSGIDRTYIGYIENGKQNLSLSILFRVAEALKVDISYFFNE